MASPKRFILEATWHGYMRSQAHVVHREALTHGRQKFEAIDSILFSDGTVMTVSVRDAAPREKVKSILGYSAVLHGAARRGLSGHSIPVESTF